MYADKMSHLHCHITPKYQGGPDWGGIFQMNPQPAVSLESSEYETIAENIRRTLAEL
jgi:diadenosine tetraphosphate (Ap4A) HIT family hydrolase